jgi:hypothetical protein
VGKHAAHLRVVEGRPWKESLICVLASGAPYRPWHGAGGIDPGDVTVVVIDTDPQTVLCTATVGPDRSVRQAIARARYRWSPMRTVAEIEESAGTSLQSSDGQPLDSPAAQAVIQAVEEYSPSTPGDRFGHSSVAAARILLQSEGRCTGCNRAIDLASPSARDNIYIHTVSVDDGPPDTAAADDVPDRLATRAEPDWPALLCSRCHAAMTRAGFANFLDYRFSRQPACPQCFAQRTKSAVYGMPSYDGFINTPPWKASQGCVVHPSSARWICGVCGHEWH